MALNVPGETDSVQSETKITGNSEYGYYSLMEDGEQMTLTNWRR